MPSAKDWKALAKETFDALDRREVADLYSAEWLQVKDELLSGERDAILATRSGFRRFLKKANAILYGLVKRLSPTRRLLFAVALVLALFGQVVFQTGRRGDGDSGVTVSLDFHTISVALLVALLGMELVDKLQFRTELFLARDVQADLLPKSLPCLDAYELGAYNRIANTVGGDLYDFAPMPDGKLAMLFGDASGHGMSAGLVMAVTHATFRTQVDVDPAPAVMMATLNKILCRTGACRTGGPRQFFAGVSLLLSPDGRFDAVVAGHPQILRLDEKGRVVERFGKGSYPVGVKEATRWGVESGALAPGQALLLYSDGLPEARNAEGMEFSDTRIESIALRKGGSPAPELTRALVAALDDFLGRRAVEDDVSIAVIKRKSEAG